MSFIFGGGDQGGSTTGTQTSIAREAPGVEARKLALYDQAAALAKDPISGGIPAIQIAGLSPLEQAGIAQAGQVGVGAGTVGQGIQSILGAPGSAVSGQQLANLAGTGAVGAAGLGQQQAGQAGQLASLYGAGAMRTAAAGPGISQFFNPYQSYVIDEINRQAQMGQNRLSAEAVASGAFGGGRQGIAQAELERARLGQIGQAQAAGFESALGAAQRQQQLATQTGLQAGQLGLGAGQLGLSGAQLGAQTGLQAGQLGLSGAQLASQTGLQAGQQLGQLGAQQQAMSLADIQAQMQAGALQRGIGQQALEAQRQTALQRAYEPYQRIEFLKGIMTNLPTTQSTLTATTAPGSNPLAQAAGTALGGYAAYNMMQPR